MISACREKSPCEKFNRAMFSPARMRRSSISGDSEAGPMVATILVLCAGNVAGFIWLEIVEITQERTSFAQVIEAS